MLQVDLRHPGVRLRATRPEERRQELSSFSRKVGAAAAVNGDYYPNFGLAAGDGLWWPDSADEGGSFLACTADKRCHIQREQSERAAWQSEWHSVVGGNYVIVRDGKPVFDASNCTFEHCTAPHPRTVSALDRTGNTLLFVVVEGRQPGYVGMSLADLGALLVELGAHIALNNDGGGSSELVVRGTRVNRFPDGQTAERTVNNHWAVLSVPYDGGATDAGVEASDAGGLDEGRDAGLDAGLEALPPTDDSGSTTEGSAAPSDGVAGLSCAVADDAIPFGLGCVLALLRRRRAVP